MYTDPTQAGPSSASTSHVPEQPPPAAAATRLPPELLDLIFTLARPPIPPVLFKRLPLSPDWRAYARLALVHSTWRPSAQRALATCVVLKSRDQMARLARALQLGESLESALLDLFKLCGHDLKTLRCRGFGEPCLADFSPALRALLPHLEAFEYSPIDESTPPVLSEFGVGMQLKLPTLKHLALHPCARRVNQLIMLPALEAMGVAMMEMMALPMEEDLPARLLHELQMRDSKPKKPAMALDFFGRVLAKVEDTLQNLTGSRAEAPSTLESGNLDSPRAGGHLESDSLHSAIISPFSLAHLLVSSVRSLTSLDLHSVWLRGSSITALIVLATFAPNLSSFALIEQLRSVVERPALNPPAAGAANNNQQQPPAGVGTPPPPLAAAPIAVPPPPPHNNAATTESASALTASRFWTLLRCLSRVESLSLSVTHAWFDSPHRKGFKLPRSFKKLSLLCPVEDARLEQEGIVWWLDRVEELLDNDDDEGTVEKRNPGAQSDANEAAAADEDGGETDADTSRNDDDDSLSSRSVSTLDPVDEAPPFPPASTTSSRAPASAHATAQSRPIPPQTAPPPPPRLLELHLATRTSPRRLSKGLLGKSINRRLDALEETTGTHTEWTGLVFVQVDMMERTRELKVEMSEVPPEWRGEGASA
ncbi:hypothetical protein JCM10908_000065 [Rhodotorula pacifica]|uniref:uncharacterized protein n=1 Tax=Rhodotorula pacifica TaxID=1495444 RepID=UPI003178D3D9